ncbi:LamG domain-containing protein [Candidatus Sumerlaeota bacterium]|nr:LamG domain-containing protein [Candidatus Sumerlaeota bacterium]
MKTIAILGVMIGISGVNGWTAQLAHYQFDGNTIDSAGAMHARVSGNPQYVQGCIGQAISLSALNDYVELPYNVVATDDMTIAMWVYWNGGGQWQRIFDFGDTGSGDLMYMTPSSGSNTFHFGIRKGNTNQTIDAPQLPSGKWVHVAVTLNGDIGALYVDGAQVASRRITLNPTAINQTSNYIGKGHGSEPPYNGLIDDFRIFDQALSQDELVSLASGSGSIGPSSLITHMQFEGDARDIAGTNNGVAMGGPIFAGGISGQTIGMDGMDDHVRLANSVLDSEDMTIAMWVSWSGGNQWQHIFDFGVDTNQYLYLTPCSGGNALRFAIRKYEINQSLDATRPLPMRQWVHVAVTLEGDTGKIFVNGEVAVSGRITLNPSDILQSNNYIAKSQWPNDPFFRGWIDDFRVYNVALSESDVAALAYGNTNVAGTSSQSATADYAKQETQQTQQSQATGPIPTSVPWKLTYQEFESEALNQQKARVLYFYNDNVPVCRRIDSEIFSAGDFLDLTRKFVCYREQIYSRGTYHQLGVYQIPSLILQDAQGRILRAYVFNNFDTDKADLMQRMGQM